VDRADQASEFTVADTLTTTRSYEDGKRILFLAPGTEVLEARRRVPALLRGSAHAFMARRAAPAEGL
jgi:hypothetical protein